MFFNTCWAEKEHFLFEKGKIALVYFYFREGIPKLFQKLFDRKDLDFWTVYLGYWNEVNRKKRTGKGRREDEGR